MVFVHDGQQTNIETNEQANNKITYKKDLQKKDFQKRLTNM